MFIRQYFKDENGQRTAYWALVASHRTRQGPRQRAVGWLGKLDEAGRLGVRQAIDSTDTATGLQDKSTRGHDRQQLLFKDDENTTKPRWEEVNVAGVRGGGGRDIVIGSIGKDTLHGNAGDDLLIGGSTANQDYLAALDQALTDWGAGNLNATLADLGLITDDGNKDDIFGDQGNDYLVGGSGDKLKQ